MEANEKIKNGVVEGFGKVTDNCVEIPFASAEDAKARLFGNDKE